MSTNKKVLSSVLSAAMLLSVMAGCSSSNSSSGLHPAAVRFQHPRRLPLEAVLVLGCQRQESFLLPKRPSH